MSYLMRNGTGRNNIVYGGNNTTSGNYLRRTSTGRNNISYINISTSGTHKLLERISTSLNSIRWNNLTFSFFTPYTGTYKSSTTITIPNGCNHIDIFCVGGGGAGRHSDYAGSTYNHGGGGGGGGYTKIVSNLSVSAGQSISIVVGNGSATYYNNGGNSSISRSGVLLCNADGAKYDSSYGWAMNPGDGGSGGGGGAEHNARRAYNGAGGGSNGSDGIPITDLQVTMNGKGQGTTTRAFGESSGTLYAGGGGGGATLQYSGTNPGSGGAGGGGAGGVRNGGYGVAGTVNTGGGGGGGGNGAEPGLRNGASGGSGIVLIRFKV